MRFTPKPIGALTAVMCTVIVTIPCAAAGKKGPITKPDFLTGDPIPAKAIHDWNLGATGLRGWMFSDRRSTAELMQILLEYGNPAKPVIPDLQEIANSLESDDHNRMRTMFPKQAAAIRDTILDTIPKLERL